jgi:hypothetical protein
MSHDFFLAAPAAAASKPCVSICVCACAVAGPHHLASARWDWRYARLYALSLRARALHSQSDARPHLEALTHLMPVMIATAVVDGVIRPPVGLPEDAIQVALVDTIERLLR